MATPIVLILGAVVALVVLVILLTPPRREQVRERRHDTSAGGGLPPGEIVYSDAGGGAEPLIARNHPLLGKPDYVIQGRDGRRMPVEIKSGRAPRTQRLRPAPRHEDVLQVVAYLIILDDLFAPAPTHGVLRYADATFEVPYAPGLRREVLRIVARMQALDAATGSRDRPPRGTPGYETCRACAFRAICDDAVDTVGGEAR
jgi:CRISPR-associated exonuclease Cas4